LAAAGGLKPHLEVLSRAQRRVLRRLAGFAGARGFYLGGGTALALHLGHRESQDFDWFSSERVNPETLAPELRESAPAVRIRSIEHATLHASVSGVLTSFLEYRYPLLRPLAKDPALQLQVASLEDIACMKLAAIAQRGSRRDFVDVYALGLELGLAEMLELYRRKYGIRDVGHVVFALANFDVADKEPSPRLLRRWSWKTIKSTLQRQVGALAG
jgi:hypothetical protein